MARTKAMTTRARELSKVLSPEQMRQLAEILAAEASKPHIDRRELNAAKRHYSTLCAHIAEAEQKLTAMLTDLGMTTGEITDELNGMRQEAERTGVKRRGPRKKQAD